MPEGPLGFPRLTNWGPFTTSGKADISDQRIKNRVQRFSPDFEIVDGKGNNPFPKWDRKDTRDSGVTGIWIKSEQLMIIEPRSGPLSKVHRELAEDISDMLEYDNIEVMPWSSVKTRTSIAKDEGWFADINSVGESIKNEYVAGELNISTLYARPEDVWPVIYTLWLTNHPYSTTTTYNYMGSEQDVFELANAYKELSFALNGLPEPEIRRTE
jgi:hypothetical protein